MVNASISTTEPARFAKVVGVNNLKLDTPIIAVTENGRTVTAMNHDKCAMCLNSRPVVSENGWHVVCCLASKSEMNCLTGKRDKFVKHPMFKDGDTK